MLSQFRNGSYPIDSWISDFEWFTATPDYSLPEQGSPTYTDFGYGPATFPDPAAQLKQYHDELHMRFGGIRKPRLGNSELLVMAHSKNWTVDADHSGGAPGGTRNLNYTVTALREWYAEQHAHYLKEGVDFWWNDEGETYYFAFYYWNLAQVAGLATYDSKKRFWTINRSYSLGMSRLGAVIWSGDIQVSWDSLVNQPGYVLNWHMAGVGYITCDSGGFNGPDTSPLLLTRWYQYAAFMPIMRVHSTHDDKPHFPFLYGEEAGDAMRDALNLRYRLLPYHYSLAHAAYQPGGISIMRPLLWSYPDDDAVSEMTTQWFDGPNLMAAPVLSQDNSSSVYLPAGDWYTFNTAGSKVRMHTGPANVTSADVPLDVIPVFVRPGAIIPLGSVIQHVGELPGGPLEVQVYSGADGTFALVEDDGETTGYAQSAGSSTRTTTFAWTEASGTLTWKVDGEYAGADVYTACSVVLFSSAGKQGPLVGKLGAGGSVTFKMQAVH